MIPLSEIKIGDLFQDPSSRGYGKYSGLIWVVVDINGKEKMVKLQPHRFTDFTPFGSPLWKKNTDRMISESWRISQ